MKRFATLVVVLVGFTLSAHAQGDASLSRGFIPPYFRVPDNTADIRFTTLEQPRYGTPEYPATHIREEREGVVEVEISCTAEGSVVHARITVSSGDAQFDESALKGAMATKFPVGYATVNGLPVDFRMRVPFYFLLSADPEQYWHTRLELARVQQEYDVAMEQFQGYITARTSATKSRFEAAKRQVEEKVALGKRLHRMLAEKKEYAILRLREEITATREHREALHAEASTPDTDAEFRKVLPGDEHVPTVTLATPQSHNVVTVSLPYQNDLDRLTQELELKKSYL